ncbi:MAG: dimethylarginine dimethylaminohydrolase family protein, partial [Gemmatimonadota bacterium]
AVFVEDTAVVLDEVAIVARPGAASRRPEVEPVAEVLREHRPLRRIREPGTLDGGDVLRIDRTLFVGASARTNPAGRHQLAEIADELGYEVVTVALRGCLHLKTAATAVAERTVLVNPEWIGPAAFAGLERIEVHPDEPFAANALWLGAVDGADVVVHAAEFPRTRARLERRGIEVRTAPASELAKAEGGVTCCSIVLRTGARTGHGSD